MLRDASLAEDATQEAFFSAYRRIGGFRGGNLRPWLLTIVANGCRDILRSPHRRRTSSLEETMEGGDPGGLLASPGPSPEDSAIQSELGRHVRDAVAQLPEDQRLVVSLVDLQGLDYEEASRAAKRLLGNRQVAAEPRPGPVACAAASLHGTLGRPSTSGR